MFGKQTLITREKHVACCRAAGAHLNFNLAKGGRQEGRKKSSEMWGSEGQVSNQPNHSEMRVICISLRVTYSIILWELVLKENKERGSAWNQKRMNCSKLFMVNYRLVCSSSLQPGNVWQPCCDWAGYLGFSQSFGIVWIYYALLPKATYPGPPEPRWSWQRYYF